MKHLTIRHFGPLREAIVDINKVNLVIGLQSSGKSCILKTACHCAWVEKHIQMAQTAGDYEESTKFIDRLLTYYKMQSYLSEHTYIEYSTDYMTFSYSHKTKHFSFKWNAARWEYKKAKVSYIPSDRNLVAAIPAWSKLSLDYDNLLDFMADWNEARKHLKTKANVLNLGMSYVYNPTANTDHVKLMNGRLIQLTESSSGVQSLIPLIVHLDYLGNRLTDDNSSKMLSFEEKEARKNLLSTLYRKHKDTVSASSSTENTYISSIEGQIFAFVDEATAQQFADLVHNFLYSDHNEIFLEEPENNLYPTTQCQLVDWLLDAVADDERQDMLFVATHSTYVLNQLLKNRPPHMKLYVSHPVSDGGLYDVTAIAEEDYQDIYDNGVDLFLNFESYV